MKEQIKQIIRDSHIFTEGVTDTNVFVVVPVNDLAERLEQALAKERAKRLSREYLDEIIHKALDIDNLLKNKESRKFLPKTISAIVEAKYEIVDEIIKAQENKKEVATAYEKRPK